MRTTRTITVLLGAAALAGGAAWSGAASATDDDNPSAQAFVDCMRSNGVPDFPDATVSDDGRIDLDYEAVRIDPFDETYRSALDACESLLPEGSELPAEPAPPADIEEACLPGAPAAP